MATGRLGFRWSAPDEGDRSGVGGVVRRIADRVGRWAVRPRNISHPDLSEFSDAQLRDIGLSRIDVERPGE